jgi:hypothetical protein
VRRSNNPEASSALRQRLKILKVRTAHAFCGASSNYYEHCFTSPDQAGLTADSMSTVSRSATGQPLNAGTAANADEMGEAHPIEHSGIEAASAWDSYEVWRRFIKDARDRRKAQADSL